MATKIKKLRLSMDEGLFDEIKGRGLLPEIDNIVSTLLEGYIKEKFGK